jgi:predicted nucleic acid-binding protein
VIFIDADILIYSHVASFSQHKAARKWLDQKLNGSTRVGLPWGSLLAFLRLVTNPRVFERPEPMADACIRCVLGSRVKQHGSRNRQSAMPIY